MADDSRSTDKNAFGSYAAIGDSFTEGVGDPGPDGLDHTIQQGCEETDTGLTGSCVAQGATDHDLADGPLADYALNGADGTTGVAGVIGVLITALVATGLFWVLRRRTRA